MVGEPPSQAERVLEGVNIRSVSSQSALEAVFRLQEQDLELDHIQEEEHQLPDKLVEARVLWDQLNLRRQDLREERLRRQSALDSTLLEIADLTEKRSRDEQEQLRAQSVREQTQYENRIQQLAARIEDLNEARRPIEDEILELEGQIEELQTEMDEVEPRLEKLERANKRRVDTLKAECRGKVEARATSAKEIPTVLLHEYESIRKARKGVGIAKVKRSSQVFRCEACSVQLPTHVAQRVHQGIQMVRCPSCGRILFMDGK